VTLRLDAGRVEATATSQSQHVAKSLRKMKRKVVRDDELLTAHSLLRQTVTVEGD